MIKNNSYVIMGSKHCGKSTHGKAIAQKLGVKFFDVDEVIERLVGMSVRDFYNKEGAAAFMQTEEFACKRIIDYTNEQESDVIISTGGGICDNPPALAQLRVCKSFVFLKLEIKDMVDRILDEMKDEPENKEEDEEEEEVIDFSKLPAFIANANPKPKTMKAVKNLLTEKFTSRNETYEKIADIVVDIKNAPIEENTNIIYRALC